MCETAVPDFRAERSVNTGAARAYRGCALSIEQVSLNIQMYTIRGYILTAGFVQQNGS